MASVRVLVSLIDQFVARELQPYEFTLSYLQTYSEIPNMSEAYFHVLDKLFAIADGFDPAVRAETATPFETTEEELRTACNEALTELRAARLLPPLGSPDSTISGLD